MKTWHAIAFLIVTARGRAGGLVGESFSEDRQNKRPSDSRCQSLGRFSRPDALEEIGKLDP
jgi:hypothetical protein